MISTKMLKVSFDPAFRGLPPRDQYSILAAMHLTATVAGIKIAGLKPEERDGLLRRTAVLREEVCRLPRLSSKRARKRCRAIRQRLAAIDNRAVKLAADDIMERLIAFCEAEGFEGTGRVIRRQLAQRRGEG